MKYLPFTPEVVRLRRLAKACQAGEMSRVEYRSLRRDVIDGFVDHVDTRGDDTIPRFVAEVTQRRMYMPMQHPAGKIASKPLVWLIVGTLLCTALLLPG